MNEEGAGANSSADGNVAPHNHGRINFTKWGPIIAAAIIGVASVTGSIVASLINRSARTPDTTVPAVTGLDAAVETVVDPGATSATSTAPLVTAPPQIIIVQVPGSTIPGGPPNTVIVTVTVLVPAPTISTKVAGPEATSTLAGGLATSTSATSTTVAGSNPVVPSSTSVQTASSVSSSGTTSLTGATTLATGGTTSANTATTVAIPPSSTSVGTSTTTAG